MTLKTLTAAIAATVVFAQAAQAREHHAHEHYARSAAFHDSSSHDSWNRRPESQYSDWAPGGAASYSEASDYHGGPGGRPRAWCGWKMRQLVGADPGPQYNLARNWAHWGHAGPPGVGAVVVWAHHVGKIVGQENGKWLIESGNDGNRVRTRAIPISNAIAIRWG